MNGQVNAQQLLQIPQHEDTAAQIQRNIQSSFTTKTHRTQKLWLQMRVTASTSRRLIYDLPLYCALESWNGHRIN
jgi:hypothetical protein